jgi:hypothetical protein
MNDGKAFENEVRYLLRLQGWGALQERLVGHKKVDAYGEKVGDFRKTTRIAVECKDYNRAMTQEQLTEIYANYLPLLQGGLIDQIVVVMSCFSWNWNVLPFGLA